MLSDLHGCSKLSGDTTNPSTSSAATTSGVYEKARAINMSSGNYVALIAVIWRAEGFKENRFKAEAPTSHDGKTSTAQHYAVQLLSNAVR